MVSLDPDSLRNPQKRRALLAIKLINKKVWKLKGQVCAYDRPQGQYKPKEGAY